MAASGPLASGPQEVDPKEVGVKEEAVRTTEQLAAAAEARQATVAQLDGLLERTTGTAEDYDGTIAAEVDGRGTLRQLWLADNAIYWGHQRLGELIVEVAQAAAMDATQRAYNAMAVPLGDTVTAAIEGLGPPAPARSAGMDTGSRISPGEFQARRDRERSAGQPDAADQDLADFDASIFRSDR